MHVYSREVFEGGARFSRGASGFLRFFRFVRTSHQKTITEMARTGPIQAESNWLQIVGHSHKSCACA